MRVEFKGPAKARNYGAAYANGDLVAFPDDDSFYSQNALEKVVDKFRKDRGLDGLAVKVAEPERNTTALNPRKNGCNGFRISRKKSKSEVVYRA